MFNTNTTGLSDQLSGYILRCHVNTTALYQPKYFTNQEMLITMPLEMFNLDDTFWLLNILVTTKQWSRSRSKSFRQVVVPHFLYCLGDPDVNLKHSMCIFEEWSTPTPSLYRIDVSLHFPTLHPMELSQ